MSSFQFENEDIPDRKPEDLAIRERKIATNTNEPIDTVNNKRMMTPATPHESEDVILE